MAIRALPLILLLGVVYCATPVSAFGAGNIASISKIEGSNWRHGDIEDTLLQLFLAASASGGRRRKFTPLDIKRIYFGNWLRDYSQAIDTGGLKYVEANTIRLLLWILSFVTFGYATGEFEVTAERLGCYRPEEHIDNPKDYNDNNDAREMDRRLRGPVDEATELGVDDQTGLKNYIANEGIRNIQSGDRMYTSAGLVRDLFTRSIQLGRKYASSGNDADLFEAFRLMGTGLHCLEDYSAHSNYTELALIELGEQDIFPHVGRRTRINVQGKEIWPLVTGTFGGVDFLHSVLGEVSDKAIQSEISQLESTISDAQREAEQGVSEDSIIKDLMSRLNLGDKDNIDNKTSELKKKSEAQKQATQEKSSPYGLGNNAEDTIREIKPYLEFHDSLMKDINTALESVGLNVVVEQLAEAVSLFVFSLIAPFIIPIIRQVSNELKTGSSEVIASSEAAQHIVFENDSSSDPTHSMLSKDHFSNVLNEPAGKIAQEVLKFAVPLLMEAWDDNNIDPNRVCDEIIGGVFHHPAFRNGEDGRGGRAGRQAMFAVVQEWWSSKSRQEQDDLRRNLSREGVKAGKNHKSGVQDCGHGCGKPLQRKGGSGKKGQGDMADNIGKAVGGALENALSGGGKEKSSGLGSMLGGFIGGAIGESMGGDKKDEKKGKKESSYSSSKQESSYSSGGYQKTSYSASTTTSSYSSSGHGRQPQSSYETRESYTESTPSYTRTTERYGGSGRDTEERTYESGHGRRGEEDRSTRSYETRGGFPGSNISSGGYGGQQEERSSGYGGQERSFGYGGQERSSGYGGQERSAGYGTQERSSGYGRQEERSSGYGGRQDDDDNRHGSRGYGQDDYKKEKKEKKSKKYDDDDDEGVKKKKEKKEKKYDDDDDDKKHKKKYDDDDDGDKKYKKKSYHDDDDDGDKKYNKEKKYGDYDDKKYKKKSYDDDDDDDEKKYKKKHDDDDDKKYKKEKKYGKKSDDEDDGYKKKKKGSDDEKEWKKSKKHEYRY